MATYTKVYDYFKRVFRKEYINKYIANTEKTIYVTGPTKSEYALSNYETCDVTFYMMENKYLSAAVLSTSGTYIDFINANFLRGEKTPHGVTWDHPSLNYAELDDVLQQMRER
jgi:hypothetical protein